MKKNIILYLFFATGCCAQDTSDYSKEALLKVRERTGICWDTVVAHKAGFKQCYHEASRWINRNKAKYRFLVTAFNTDSGSIQVALLSECKLLKKTPATEYYMVLASSSNSFRISYENINPLSKDCMAGLRNAMKVEIINSIMALPDSLEPRPPNPNRGLGFSERSPLCAPSTLDSVFQAIKTDSIRKADSVARAALRADSVAKANSLALSKYNGSLDTAVLQREADSIASVVEADSIDMRKRDCAIFKGQSILKGKKMSFGTRMECLQFMLSKNLTTVQKAIEYLTALKKYCADRQCLFFSLRYLVDDEDKTMCMLYFRKARDEDARIQAELERLIGISQ